MREGTLFAVPYELLRFDRNLEGGAALRTS